MMAAVSPASRPQRARPARYVGRVGPEFPHLGGILRGTYPTSVTLLTAGRPRRRDTVDGVHLVAPIGQPRRHHAGVVSPGWLLISTPTSDSATSMLPSPSPSKTNDANEIDSGYATPCTAKWRRRHTSSIAPGNHARGAAVLTSTPKPSSPKAPCSSRTPSAHAMTPRKLDSKKHTRPADLTATAPWVRSRSIAANVARRQHCHRRGSTGSPPCCEHPPPTTS